MWFSFLYVVYFLAAGFRSRKKDISYKKEANMIKDITTSVVLFTLVSVIFAYGHTAFFKNESKTCEVVTLKEYNKYLNYENFVNSSKDDYERGRHENLRTSLIWYNEKCKKYSEEDKEIINCNFLKFSKKQVEYNKKQGW